MAEVDHTTGGSAMTAQPADSRGATERQSRIDKLLSFIDAVGNMLFYLCAFLILIVPLLKWVSDWFAGSSSPGMVLLAILVFVFVLPTVVPVLANWSMSLMEKIRQGELLAIVFRPFRAACAVASIFGLLALEYRALHGESEQSIFSVYCELIKSLFS